MDYEWMTPEDFAAAKANGISYENAYARFYNYGWSKEDTINKPLHKPNLWNQYKELANKNGIKQGTFYDRMNRGISPESAATLPRMPRGGCTKPVIITPEVVKQAADNGISKETLKHRVHFYKWSIERAVTEPVKTQYRRKNYETISS